MLRSRGALTCLLLSLLCLGALRISSASAALDSHYVRRASGNDWVIVFVHGVIGDSQSTWTNGNVYWPSLLTTDRDFDGADIYVYQYPTSALGNALSINEIAENMRVIFNADDVGAHQNIVFLAHSMGGIVVRNYLLKYRSIADHVRMTYFFSTPTTGSEIASLLSLFIKDRQISKLKLMDSADYLADVQRDWLAANFSIPSYCAYETRPTYGVTVVTQASASNLCNRALDPIDADHIGIVKPGSVRDVSYLAFKSAYKQVRARAQIPLRGPTLVTKDTDVVEPIDIPGAGAFQLHATFQVRFSKSAFNEDTYLQALRRSDIAGLPDSEDSAVVGLISSTALQTSIRPLSATPGTSALGFEATIYLHKPPLPGQQFVFNAGPKQWSINFGEMTWFPFGKNAAHSWARGQVLLTADDPDWMVLHSARLLPLTSSAGSKSSILEVNLENLSPRTFAGTDVVISAYGDSSAECAALPDQNNWQEPAQKLVINWRQLVPRHNAKDPNDVAWTPIGNARVPVQASFRERGCWNPREFIASVPVDLAIEPGHPGTIRLTIDEIPQPPDLKRQRDLGLDREPIQPLYLWPHVSVSVEPNKRMYPTSISVR